MSYAFSEIVRQLLSELLIHKTFRDKDKILDKNLIKKNFYGVIFVLIWNNAYNVSVTLFSDLESR